MKPSQVTDMFLELTLATDDFGGSMEFSFLWSDLAIDLIINSILSISTSVTSLRLCLDCIEKAFPVDNINDKKFKIKRNKLLKEREKFQIVTSSAYSSGLTRISSPPSSCMPLEHTQL